MKTKRTVKPGTPKKPRRNAPKAPLIALPFSPAFLSVLVALFSIALYLPAINFDFVYDSHPIILMGSFIHQPRHFADLLTLHVLAMDVMDFNRPMNLFSLMADSLLWGRDAPGYHLTNMLLHATTAALLFRWLFALVGQRWPALLAALLFAAHPLHCEAVAEVCNRKDLLATLFMLAGLLCAIRFRGRAGVPPAGVAVSATRRRARDPRRGLLAVSEGETPSVAGETPALPLHWLPAAGTVLFLFLSVASKESGVAGPAILAAYWFLFRRQEKRGPWLLLLALAGAAVAAFLVARFALEPKNSIIFTEKPVWLAAGWGGLLRTQTRIWAAEFLRIVWPSPGSLCADYNGYSIRNIMFLPALLGVAALVALQGVLFAVVGNRANRPTQKFRIRQDEQDLQDSEFSCRVALPPRGHGNLIALAAAVFWFSLLPVSNLIPIYHAMADRFLYMPLLGVALALAVLMAGIGRTGRAAVHLKPLAIAVGLVALGTLATLTWNEEQTWRDDLSLWGTTAERNPGSFNALIGLSSAWINHHEPEKAFAPLQEAIQLSKGNRAEPFAVLALAFDALGRQQDAARNLARAAELDPRYNHPDTLLEAMVSDPWEAQRYSLIAARSRRF